MVARWDLNFIIPDDHLYYVFSFILILLFTDDMNVCFLIYYGTILHTYIENSTTLDNGQEYSKPKYADKISLEIGARERGFRGIFCMAHFGGGHTITEYVTNMPRINSTERA